MFLVLNHCFQQVEEYNNGDAITFWWVLYIDRSSCRLYSFDLSAKAAPKRDSAGTAFDLVFFLLGAQVCNFHCYKADMQGCARCHGIAWPCSQPIQFSNLKGLAHLRFFIICSAAMADPVEECVYDYIIIAAGATMDTLTLPPPGNPGWHGLPCRQVERIAQRDHMVLYLTRMGASYPFKLKEARDDLSLMLYERRGCCDCVVKRMPKGPTASCMQTVGACNISIEVHASKNTACE